MGHREIAHAFSLFRIYFYPQNQIIRTKSFVRIGDFNSFRYICNVNVK